MVVVVVRDVVRDVVVVDVEVVDGFDVDVVDSIASIDAMRTSNTRTALRSASS